MTAEEVRHDERLEQLTALDGHEFNALRMSPSTSNGVGLVVLQEFFGVNDHIRDICRMYVRDGFDVISPILYHRVGKDDPFGISLPYTDESISLGRKLRSQVGWDNAMRDVAAAAAALNRRKLGVLGYCWGGTLAWLSATRLGIDRAIGYYGGQIHEFAHEVPRCSVMLHFGERDPAIPLERVNLVRSTHPDVEIHVYPDAGHSFNCNKSPKFHAESSRVAFERTAKVLDDLKALAV